MAERKIVRGVFLNNKMFTPGMEEELSNTLTQSEADRLSAKGYLEGKWTTKGKEAAPAKEEKK